MFSASRGDHTNEGKKRRRPVNRPAQDQIPVTFPTETQTEQTEEQHKFTAIIFPRYAPETNIVAPLTDSPRKLDGEHSIANCMKCSSPFQI